MTIQSSVLIAVFAVFIFPAYKDDYVSRETLATFLHLRLLFDTCLACLVASLVHAVMVEIYTCTYFIFIGWASHPTRPPFDQTGRLLHTKREERFMNNKRLKIDYDN
eukprot:1152620-Pelagomonas_calceolata.AAC.5